MSPKNLFFVALTGLLVTCGGAPDVPARPDVVLVVCDTLRADRLSCYGYSRETSPVIDGLASEGVLFEDVTCQWPWTLPSMVSLFQGQYINAYRDLLEAHVPSLPELFQQAGYRTVGVVANCLVDASQGFDRGFDRFDCVTCWAEDGSRDDSQRDIVEMQRVVRENVREALTLDADGTRPPLFLFMHAYDPHDPYTSHAQFAKDLPMKQSVPVSPEGYWEDTLAEYQPEADLKLQGEALERLARQRGRYDQEVRFFDTGLGSILAELRELGMGDDTVHALVSDHGEGLWEHLRNDKPERLANLPPGQFFYQIHGGNGYQPVMATPFVMWGGAVPSGLRISQAVENVDLFPTLLELANITPPEGLDGRSLVPLMAGEESDWREYAYCYGSHAIAVRHVASGDKLIIPSGKSVENGRELELYNLKDDPHERVNLAEQEPERVKRLIEQYTRWMDANPMQSTSQERGHGDQVDRDRAALEEKLRSLGYTGLETGGPGK